MNAKDFLNDNDPCLVHNDGKNKGKQLRLR